MPPGPRTAKVPEGAPLVRAPQLLAKSEDASR
jgi:hypothetical protein